MAGKALERYGAEMITEWMVQKGIAQHGIAAGHIFQGLKLHGLPDDEAKSRVMLYRKWRPKTDKKNQVPTQQAFQLAIAGIDPDDVEPRQIEMEMEQCTTSPA